MNIFTFLAVFCVLISVFTDVDIQLFTRSIVCEHLHLPCSLDRCQHSIVHTEHCLWTYVTFLAVFCVLISVFTDVDIQLFTRSIVCEHLHLPCSLDRCQHSIVHMEHCLWTPVPYLQSSVCCLQSSQMSAFDCSHRALSVVLIHVPALQSSVCWLQSPQMLPFNCSHGALSVNTSTCLAVFCVLTSVSTDVGIHLFSRSIVCEDLHLPCRGCSLLCVDLSLHRCQHSSVHTCQHSSVHTEHCLWSPLLPCCLLFVDFSLHRCQHSAVHTEHGLWTPSPSLQSSVCWLQSFFCNDDYNTYMYRKQISIYHHVFLILIAVLELLLHSFYIYYIYSLFSYHKNWHCHVLPFWPSQHVVTASCFQKVTIKCWRDWELISWITLSQCITYLVWFSSPTYWMAYCVESEACIYPSTAHSRLISFCSATFCCLLLSCRLFLMYSFMYSFLSAFAGTFSDELCGWGVSFFCAL